MTRNRRGNRLPIERWTRDCLDVRFLKREGFLDGSWVAIGPSLRWPRIARMRIARYLLILDLQGHSVPQHIRASWTRAFPTQAYSDGYPAWMKKLRQSAGFISSVAMAQALQRPSSVRLASLRKMFLNLAKACSIGSRSGL